MQHLDETYLLLALLLLLGLGLSCERPARQLDRLVEQYQNTQQTSLSFLQPSKSAPLYPAPEVLETGFNTWLNTYRQWQAIDSTALGAKQMGKYRQFSQQLRRDKKSLIRWKRDPSRYNFSGWLKQYISDTNQSLDTRVEKLSSILHIAPDYYAAAKQNLQQPSVHALELCQRKQIRSLDFLYHSLADSIQAAHISKATQQALDASLRQCIVATKDYLAYCRSMHINLRDSITQAAATPAHYHPAYVIE